MHKTHTFTAVSDGAGGFEVLEITAKDIGCRLSDTNRSVQLHAANLDGGNWSIYVKPKGSDNYFIFQTAATEIDLVSVPVDWVSFDDMAIEFTNLGALAAPVITHTSFVKKF